jgi:acylpyruvate hydrolase
MRFVSFVMDGNNGLAVEAAGGKLNGLTDDQAGWPGDLDDIVRSGDFAKAADALRAGAEIDPETVRFALPFRRAGKVLCVGLNYADHAKESKMEAPAFPTVFVRFNSNLVPHGATLVRPDASDQFDYEGEVVAVIGKAGRAIPKDKALEHVAGYTIFNDGSIRDFQLRTNQWTIGKNFDDTGALGPCFVTADDLPAGAKGLRLTTRLNGEVMQDATTDDLIFSVADLVSHLSVGMALEPGDLIVTGTPSGVGAARDPQVFMKPGDVCEIEVEKIGLLRNDVVAA